MISQPHTWTLGIAFIDRVTDVNNSPGRKRMYPSRGLGAPVYLVEEKGYDFDTYEWPRTKNDLPQRSQ